MFFDCIFNWCARCIISIKLITVSSLHRVLRKLIHYCYSTHYPRPAVRPSSAGSEGAVRVGRLDLPAGSSNTEKPRAYLLGVLILALLDQNTSRAPREVPK